MDTCGTQTLVSNQIVIKSKVVDYRISLVLHIPPITFLGAGSRGPLSLCPDVKYSQPFQNPTRVVLIRKGILPTTDHSCINNYNIFQSQHWGANLANKYKIIEICNQHWGGLYLRAWALDMILNMSLILMSLQTVFLLLEFYIYRL